MVMGISRARCWRATFELWPEIFISPVHLGRQKIVTRRKEVPRSAVVLTYAIQDRVS